MSNINLEILPHAFPMLLKDIDLGIYLIESKIPDGTFDLGRVQIMLDSNVMNAASSIPEIFAQKMSWYYGTQSTVSLNPALAIVEQCLSNSRENALKHVRCFESAFEPIGMFPNGYAETITKDVYRRDADMRQQAGFLFCFVALLRHHYLDTKSGDIDQFQKWINLFSSDIPRPGLMYWLGGLFILSRSNSRLKFLRQTSPIEKFAEGFCRFRKEESGDYTRWLRNRTFDLLLFLLSPTLSFESLGGFSSRTILTSKDKFIGEFLGRFFCWYGEPKLNQSWRLVALISMVDAQHESIAHCIQMLIQSYPEIRQQPDQHMKNSRLRNLIDLTLGTLDTTERNSLHTALYEFRIFDELKKM